jgi:folate-binding protein YgfZ
MQLDFVRFEGGTFKLSDWELYKISGKDSYKFLQGQTTNDLNNLKFNDSIISCRLNRTGQLLSFFYIAQKEDYYLLLIPKAFGAKTVNDFLKFIIMEDVEISPFLQEPTLLITPLRDQLKDYFNLREMFYLKFFGEEATLLWGENAKLETPFLPISEEDFRTLSVLSGYPSVDEILKQEKLVNEFFLNEIAVSYKKGCFLGQETVAKVENFRGPAYYPVLLRVIGAFDLKFGPKNFELEERKAGEFIDICHYDGDTYIKASLFRDFRIENRELIFNDFKASVIYFPFFKKNSSHEKTVELYHRAVDCFKNNEESLAIDLLERSIAIDKTFPDSYESLGVIFGRQGKYQEAINLMDKLLLVDPASIMAHTNKSLYLMKLGRIEEAEAEKEKAIVKKFEKLGDEVAVRKEEETKKIKEEADLLRRQEMFKQVLELDASDVIANFGLADILFKKEKYEEALPFLETVLENDPKYSKGYLLLGKTLEALGKISLAKEIYTNGITVASKKGEMMPANEMQSRLSKLS